MSRELVRLNYPDGQEIEQNCPGGQRGSENMRVISTFVT